jgi:tyrosine-specific transport protein
MELRMQPAKSNGAAKRRTDSLSAVSIFEDSESNEKSSVFDSNFLETSLLPVLSTSLMITGNTVGAGMLVLPELVAGPGMAISTSIFVGAFLVNLISGLIIAEVAINQHDASGSDVPSSFKDFAEVNLNSHSAANVIGGISVFVNALVMAFNTVKIGDVGSSMAQGMVPSGAISMAWALACVTLVGTQTLTSLSTVTSLMVTVLFVSFAGLLLPGLAHMSADPISILMAPGTSTDVMASACQLFPIILMSLVYQNIVPIVTKMLNYDRSKTAVAISLGSLIPLGMYVAWAFAVVGGGVDTSVGLDGPLMTLFTIITIAGSSIGCVMSLSEEFDTFLKQPKEKSTNENEDKFSLPAVVASVGCALIASQFFADDLNEALKVAGSFGSPLLYGVLPVVMAYTQRQNAKSSSSTPMLPDFGLGLLGAASSGFVGSELLHSAGDALTMLPL